MRTRLVRFREFYGANPLHLLALMASFALLGCVITAVGPSSLLSGVWWQSILVWFLGAVVLHDLVLFPLYALADLSLAAGVHAMSARRKTAIPVVSALNYLRIPFLASGLLFLVFFPGIIKQGADTYFRATGQTQEPFLHRWLLLTGLAFAVSALAYATRLALSRRNAAPTEGRGLIDPPGLPPSDAPVDSPG